MNANTLNPKIEFRKPTLFYLCLSACICGSLSFSVFADKLYLRTGEVLEGKIVGETEAQYTFSQNSGVQTIPRKTVILSIYSDPAEAARRLGLDEARKLCSDTSLYDVDILPTDTIGNAVNQAAESATQSVCILTYYLGGQNYGPMKTFYDTLQKKAKNGLNVTIICSFGPTTTTGVKKDTMNFATTLEPSGIHVLYIDSAKVQHKKMVIADDLEVILGSSNLTESGMSSSDEINVSIKSPTFIQAARADFEELRAIAKPASELNF